MAYPETHTAYRQFALTFILICRLSKNITQFKMIGGVLVEKSVDDVIKLLDEEKKELEKTKTTIEKELVETKKKMDEWMTKNKVKVMRQ